MKDIKGFEGLYAISRNGKVWCYPRTIIQKSPWGGFMKRKWKGHWLKSNTNKKGDWYMSIALQRENRKIRKGFKVHRLLAQAFIPNPLNLLEVNHKNGIKTDNRIENLEWVTRKQNMEHSWEKGFSKPLPHKLTSKQVLEIRNKYSRKEYKKIGRKYKVSPSTIGEILRRKTWTHI